MHMYSVYMYCNGCVYIPSENAYAVCSNTQEQYYHHRWKHVTVRTAVAVVYIYVHVHVHVK